MEQPQLQFEAIVRQDSSNVEAVHFLAVWHLDRHSFHQARKYFGHLATLCSNNPDVWLCLSVCCAMGEEFSESALALKNAMKLIENVNDDVRVKFCHALMSEKRKEFSIAMDGYMHCLSQCSAVEAQTDNHSLLNEGATNPTEFLFIKELRGEVMLRIAILKKDMGSVDQALAMCNNLCVEPNFGESIRANALCLKGLLHEMRGEFPSSEVVYRSVLQLSPGHSSALERLGRVYLRYRETIPAAVQCFFKSVESNPSNHTSWYLLGRCYMATSQYSDACEAYNRAVNLNPNDPQVWCSLGVLYYAFGQYREALGMLARALRLDSTMADAWYNVGALYDMCEQPEDAQLAYLKAKENGLADRFAKAGIGLNPIAMQYLQTTAGGSSSAVSGGSSGDLMSLGQQTGGNATQEQARTNMAPLNLPTAARGHQQQPSPPSQIQQQQQQLMYQQQQQHVHRQLHNNATPLRQHLTTQQQQQIAEQQYHQQRQLQQHITSQPIQQQRSNSSKNLPSMQQMQSMQQAQSYHMPIMANIQIQHFNTIRQQVGQPLSQQQQQYIPNNNQYFQMGNIYNDPAAQQLQQQQIQLQFQQLQQQHQMQLQQEGLQLLFDNSLDPETLDAAEGNHD
mmetsp:Transcript_33276/g.48149  ORF Transcript_33276/g.48149 Transcript_33276/m.48149 type:complete len:622 (+) Transcript_33276:53-1918(+)